MNLIESFLYMIPDHSINELLISLILCAILAGFAYKFNILDFKGGILALGIGIIIAVFADVYWLITLICFLAVTYLVTIFNYESKKSRGVAQGLRGERGIRSVFANGTFPAAIAFFRVFLGDHNATILYIASISIAASDTFANEIGLLAKDPVLITNPSKHVKPGTDGGITKLGEAAALLGAFIPSILGWIFISELTSDSFIQAPIDHPPLYLGFLLIPIIIGFVGCQIDSLIGATAQSKGWVDNDEVNYLSVCAGLLIAVIIIFLIPINFKIPI
jgi:uncharacterized protein (TIGR00297 family)